ncbi:hypothetical protein B0H19DRAFT_1085702 [Mycena capillaripes]|nr:hypothetical protein B0H19DRAFT_1085702 [Mycena capillaripes]
MLNVFVPPELAESFVAYMNAQGGPLPPSFSELSSRFSAALAAPTPTPAHNLSQLPTQGTRSSQASSRSATTSAGGVQGTLLPRRAGASRRMHSLPPEDVQRPEEFLAALQRHILPALPILRRAITAAVPLLQSSPPIPDIISTSLPFDLAVSQSSPFSSSPTLQGDNTPLSRGSPSASALERTRCQRDEDDEESNNEEDEEDDEAEWRRLEEAAQRARNSWTGRMIRIPAHRAAAGAGDGGGNGGAAGGGNHINLWTPDCPRRGDAERAGSATDIGHMPCNQAGCRDCEGRGGGEEKDNNEDDAGQGSGQGLQRRRNNNAQGGKSKKAKKAKINWRVDDDGGPPVTEGAGLLLSKLLAVFGRAHRQELEEVLAGKIDGSLSITSHDMASVVASIKQQTNEIRVRELHLMLSLIQLALNVDSLRADNKLKCLPRRRVTDKTLAEQYAPGTHENTFRDWVHHGKKLLLLCAGGGGHLVAGLCTEACQTWDVAAYGASTDDAHILYARLLFRICGGLAPPLNVPQPVGSHLPEVQTFAFRDLDVSDSVFDGTETNFPILHKRSSKWDSTSVPAWKPLPDPYKTKLAPIFSLRTPLKYQKTPSPVTKANRNEFTNTQRGKAEGAPVAKNLRDLQAWVQFNMTVNHLHAGGKAKQGEYVKIRSDILEGHALHMVDDNSKLLSLLFVVPPREFKDANSQDAFFKYLACHYSWYARYAEKGTGAPKTHPDNRNVHRSKNMKDPNEYSVLVEAYTDFFEILRIALKEYLPEDYDELSIFVEHLPLDASSPCYPFGDKKLCLVVPFGSFTGGELCLYETGFCFDLKLGDVLVFPVQGVHWYYIQIVRVTAGLGIVTDGLVTLFVILSPAILLAAAILWKRKLRDEWVKTMG